MKYEECAKYARAIAQKIIYLKHINKTKCECTPLNRLQKIHPCMHLYLNNPWQMVHSEGFSPSWKSQCDLHRFRKNQGKPFYK